METKRAFKIFTLLMVLTMVSDRILFVVFPNYLLNKQFSATQVGLVFSLASLILVLSRFFIGRISDIHGRKRIMGIGLLLNSISIGAFPFLSRIYEFILAKGLKEISSTLTTSVEDAIIADTFKRGIRGRVLAKLGTLYPLSRAIGAICGFIIVSYFSLIHGFYFASISIFSGFLVFMIFFREKRDRQKIRLFRLPVLASVKNYPKRFKTITLVRLLEALAFNIAYFPGFFILARSLGVTEDLLFLYFLVSYIISGAVVNHLRKKAGRFGTPFLFISLLSFSLFTTMYAFSYNQMLFFIALLMIAVSYYSSKQNFLDF